VTDQQSPLPPPDLSTPEGKAAYRRELKGVAKTQRAAGFALVGLGALIVVARSAGWLGPVQTTPDYLALAILAGGWVFLVWAFLMRNRYHRRRMSEI